MLLSYCLRCAVFLQIPDIWEDMMMIDIDHVSFQYSGAEQENLQDFNLQIKKGECVVLTGESGCGKTCVTRLINTLIPHFYEGEMSGAVLIDGVDTRTIQPHDLSDKIGSVSKIRAVNSSAWIRTARLCLVWKIRGCLIK